MSKPRVVIADTDINYIYPLQIKFAHDFYDEVELEIISSRDYFVSFFSAPQKIDVLIISDDLYNDVIRRHNIAHIFVMNEQYEDFGRNGNVYQLYKYTSIKEIFSNIIQIASNVLKTKLAQSAEPQVIMFFSASGGVGKTTLSIGVASYLNKKFQKRVLYINADSLQSFQSILNDTTPINSSNVYTKLILNKGNIYNDVKYAIRTEGFSYLPPFKSALMSLGIDYSVYYQIIKETKESGDYDFIIVDCDINFDDKKAQLISEADKVFIITKQYYSSVIATNLLVSNISGAGTEKYIFICNDFVEQEENILINPEVTLNFSVNDYVEHFNDNRRIKPDFLVKQSSIQRLAHLLS